MADTPLSEDEQNRRRQAIREIFPSTPFMGWMGVVFDRYEPDEVVLRLEPRGRWKPSGHGMELSVSAGW